MVHTQYASPDWWLQQMAFLQAQGVVVKFSSFKRQVASQRTGLPLARPVRPAAGSNDVVARFDAELRHVYVSPSISDYTGMAPEFFIGKSNRDLGMPTFTVDRWDQRLREVFLTGVPAEFQFSFESLKGVRQFVSVLTPEYDSQGKVQHVLSVAQDITVHCLRFPAQADGPAPQPWSEVEHDTMANHFRSIVQSSDDAIISKTLDGRVISWNLAAQTMFGYTREEMVGQSLLLLFPPDRVDEERFILERLLAGETVSHFETVRIRKDGTPVEVSVTISPIFDRHSWIVGASKIARDITQRKRDEANLLLASSVFTHTSEGVAIADAQGRLVEVNQAFSRITGYAREEVLGQGHQFFKSGKQGPEVIQEMLATLRAKDHCQGEIWSRTKSGKAYAVLLTVSAVRDVDGRIQRYVVLFSDITPLRMEQEKIEHVAHYDALTDLPNRLLLSDRLQRAMAMSQRNRQTLAVLYLDLDGFKQVNDRYGHSVGDALLIALARRITQVLREVDTLARMGGDEFVAVLADVQGPDQCMHLVQRILRVCAEPITLEDQVLSVSASIGVTLYPQDGSDAEQLIRHADRAMYEAKQSGKNRYYLFDANKDAAFRTQGEQIRRLSSALNLQEFVLHYQPKASLKTGEVVGMEALIRWQHPELGLLQPAAFLPTMERHALNEAVGAWVMEAALRQMTQWCDLGLRMPVSVNVSARQIQDPAFASHLAELLALYPTVQAQDLELEILETSALEDMGAVSLVMNACQRLGVRFAIDDFGTGYSSLTYLKKLPAGTLKIDQSFVRDMLVDSEDLAIVQGVIGLAQAFHRTVIAEGVETMAHGARLLALGCELAQGYGIAKPMPGAQVPSWIAQWHASGAWVHAANASL